MKFQLEFNPPSLAVPISIRKPVWLSGSCFAANMSEYFLRNRFISHSNPNGILFNPVSLLHGLYHDVLCKEYTFSDCVQQDKLWHSIHHHGVFGSTSKTGLLQNINERMEASHTFLKTTDWIILTFGSAWVYELTTSKTIVANCHKLSADLFQKRLLQPGEIEMLFDDVYAKVKQLNNSAKFIFTVSPVRYLRDGLVENNLSKSVLLQSVHRITQQYKDCFYFPAYEMVMDVLRDYRFFEADMVHPNKQAIDYVWMKFTESFTDSETKAFIKSYEAVLTARAHRPLHKVPEEWERFTGIMHQKINELKTTYPFIDFREDEQYFS
ncbi:MAG: GSCFA domain-containing protein [Bacteroidia bacterium]|nr:GSCFA domain-containing protein [Bacteroidia bacterium]